MARYFTSVHGLAPQVAPAITPCIPVSPTSTFWADSTVRGYPGNLAVPTPKPGVHYYDGLGSTQPSRQAPDTMLPSQYYCGRIPQGWRHIRYRADNIMPVPATNLFNMPGVAMRARRTGGRYQIAQPAVAQQWPDVLGRIGFQRFRVVGGPRNQGGGR